jgi:hypothetical protein
MPELLIGCGSNLEKKLALPGKETWTQLVTLDYEPSHKPDIIHDLHRIPLPFEDNTFDEIHAYEVLEHVGKQGDWKFFFDQFSDFYRILKHDGVMIGTVPHWQSVWAWGDPSHTRVIPGAAFTFLVQPQYTVQVGVTPMSDFRSRYKADFDIVYLKEDVNAGTQFALKAVKPSRISV